MSPSWSLCHSDHPNQWLVTTWPPCDPDKKVFVRAVLQSCDVLNVCVLNSGWHQIKMSSGQNDIRSKSKSKWHQIKMSSATESALNFSLKTNSLPTSKLPQIRQMRGIIINCLALTSLVLYFNMCAIKPILSTSKSTVT